MKKINIARAIRNVAVACLLVLIALPLSTLPLETSFRFAVLGDTPYTTSAEAKLLGLFPNIEAHGMPFVVHVGDIWAGSTPCTVANYESRRSIFDQSAIPLVVVPGDNEFTDCMEAGDTNPIDALTALGRFYDAILENPDGTLTDIVIGGQSVQRQANRIENVRWSYKYTSTQGVQFLGLNYPGGNYLNSMTPAQYDAMIADNIAFMDETFTLAGADPDIKALVIFLQTKPAIHGATPASCNYKCMFYESMRYHVMALNKPVLLIHGDFHKYYFDQPFLDAAGNVIGNWWRLETTGQVTDWDEVEFNYYDAAAPFKIHNHLPSSENGPPLPNDLFGTSVVMADFNGDQLADMAVGSPGRDNYGGAVTVTLSNGTLKAHKGHLLQQGKSTPINPTITGGVEANDRFGTAVTAGDFNNDGYSDLVIGVPGEAPGALPAGGAINVLWGGPGGFGSQQFIYQDLTWIGGITEAGDEFGAALTACDFNNDGYDDLVVASPGENLSGQVSTGAMNVFWGGPGGFTGNALLYYQGIRSIDGSIETNDRFGETLASGDFNGDGYCDLAVGVPGEGITAASGGAVNLLWGHAGGLSGGALVYQGVSQIGGGQETSDEFASALVAGDLNNDGIDELVIGAPGEAVGSEQAGGVFHVLWGSSSSFLSDGILYRQGTYGIAGGAENGDRFGSAFAVGDLNNDGYNDLLVGAPGEAPGALAAGGALNIVWGSSSGFSNGANTLLWESHSFLLDWYYLGTLFSGDAFGAALATGDFNNDGYDDVIIGIPGKGYDSGRILIREGFDFY